MRYIIFGRFQGTREVIDHAETESDAVYLVGEYRMAYGPGWSISWKAVADDAIGEES